MTEESEQPKASTIKNEPRREATPAPALPEPPSAKTPSQNTIYKWAAIAQIIAMFAAVIGVFVAVVPLYREISLVKSGVGGVAQRMDRVESNLKDLGFKVTYPLNGGTVAFTDAVVGFSPYQDMNHYLIVTPIMNGEDFVQSKKISVASDGTWSANAEFGQGAVGDGQKFAIRVIGTRSTLSPGRLESIPVDAKVTGTIVVTRKDK